MGYVYIMGYQDDDRVAIDGFLIKCWCNFEHK